MQSTPNTQYPLFDNRPGDPPARYWKWRTTDFPQDWRDRVKPFVNGEKWSLLLYGGTGSCKSCFASAILAYRRMKLPPDNRVPGNAGGIWLDYDTLNRQMRRVAEWPTTAASYAKRAFVVFDDLGAARATDYVLSELTDLLFARWKNQRQTIITTNHSPEQLEQWFSERLGSRLHEGIILQATGIDKRKEA